MNTGAPTISEVRLDVGSEAGQGVICLYGMGASYAECSHSLLVSGDTIRRYQ